MANPQLAATVLIKFFEMDGVDRYFGLLIARSSHNAASSLPEFSRMEFKGSGMREEEPECDDVEGKVKSFPAAVKYSTSNPS